MAQNEFELVQKLKAKVANALEAVVRLHTAHLYKASLGLGFTANEAEDITQVFGLLFLKPLLNFSSVLH